MCTLDEHWLQQNRGLDTNSCCVNHSYLGDFEDLGTRIHAHDKLFIDVEALLAFLAAQLEIFFFKAENLNQNFALEQCVVNSPYFLHVHVNQLHAYNRLNSYDFVRKSAHKQFIRKLYRCIALHRKIIRHSYKQTYLTIKFRYSCSI